MKFARILTLTLCAPLLGSCWLIFPSPPPPPASINLSFTLPEIPAAAQGKAYLGVFWYDKDANAYPFGSSQAVNGTETKLYLYGYELQSLESNPKFQLSLLEGEARDLSATNLSGADGVRTGTLYPFIWNDVTANGKYDPLSDKVLFDTNDLISYTNKDFSYSFEGNHNGTAFRQSGKRRQGWTHVRHLVISGAAGNEVSWNSLAADSPSLYQLRMKEPTDFASSMEVKR